MRRVSSSCSPPSLKPKTAAALSEHAGEQSDARAARRPARGARATTSSTPRALCSNTRIGARVRPSRSRPRRIRRPRRSAHRSPAAPARARSPRPSPPCGRAGGRRRAPAERGVVRAPGREPVDLRAHHAVEEFGGALRQFERPEQEARRPSAPVRRGCRAASPRRCRDAARRSARRRPSRARTAGRTACRVRPADHERAVVLLDHLHALARAERRQQRRRSRPRRCRSSARRRP